MLDSIGELAEQALREVRSSKIVKLAQHQILKEAQTKPTMHTEVGKVLMKLAVELRNETEDVTVSEFENFISENGNAS